MSPTEVAAATSATGGSANGSASRLPTVVAAAVANVVLLIACLVAMLAILAELDGRTQGRAQIETAILRAQEASGAAGDVVVRRIGQRRTLYHGAALDALHDLEAGGSGSLLDSIRTAVLRVEAEAISLAHLPVDRLQVLDSPNAGEDADIGGMQFTLQSYQDFMSGGLAVGASSDQDSLISLAGVLSRIESASSSALTTFLALSAVLFGVFVTGRLGTPPTVWQIVGGIGAGMLVALFLNSGPRVFLTGQGVEQIRTDPYATAFLGVLAGLFADRTYDFLHEMVEDWIERYSPRSVGKGASHATQPTDPDTLL